MGLTQKAALTTAHSALLPGASQLVAVFVHTPALPRAAMALRGFVIALLITPRYEGSWGKQKRRDAQGYCPLRHIRGSQSDSIGCRTRGWGGWPLLSQDYRALGLAQGWAGFLLFLL